MKLAHVRVAGGGLVIHAWASGLGVCALFVGDPPAEAVQPAARPVEGIEIAAAEGSLEALAQALARYLEGGPLRWDGPLDLRGVGAFQRDVFDAVRAIPHGEIRRYRDVAGAVGRPRAVRAVGDALRRNPFPIVVPCHRVVAARDLGGYAAGVAAKRRLLALEAGQRELPWEEGRG
ncbi:MAG: methylated-DNA--[protein]-cysteine S-methyltransferase [bacterium]